MSYVTHDAPTVDKLAQSNARAWEPKEHKPTLTFGRAAFRTYSTTKPKIAAWVPVAKERQ
jgi:hypothetical protein